MALRYEYQEPDCIVLGPKPGHEPSTSPPVRIFLGTQPEQYRPERVFFWSIEQVRDPARTYEIYLMKSLGGYRNTQFWNTGFTNYRFAIPHYAGFRGRAIYNDVDQTYHEDPGILFDMDMNGHAVLAVSRTDTSVMLLDCEKMKSFWTLGKAQRKRKYPLIAEVQKDPQAYGPLDETWNVRDTEYVTGLTKCYHYTILQYQPWRPLKERFYYRPNKHGGKLWLDLEESADKAGFHVHNRSRASRSLRQAVTTDPELLQQNFEPQLMTSICRELRERCHPETVLELSGTVAAQGAGGVRSTSMFDLFAGPDGLESDALLDGIEITADLSAWPRDDLPWMIGELFSHCRGYVALCVRVPDAIDVSPRKRRQLMQKEAEWWTWAFEAASRAHPEVYWRVALLPGEGCDLDDVEFCRGGAHPEEQPPVTWVLSDEKPGHTTQSLGLAQELGWPWEERQLRFNKAGELPNAMVKGTTASLADESAPIDGPPWPDLVIATGRRCVPIAEWIRQRSNGRTRTVQMGRIGTSLNDRFDVGVAPVYAGLYPDPRRIETATPLTRVNESALQEARARWEGELPSAPGPKIALLVGGTNAEHSFSPACARELGQAVAALAVREGGTVWVSTSRRTSRAAADALLDGLGDTCAHVHVWHNDKEGASNPYMGYLALADALVVTGESASMLAEACSTGKRVAIFPLPKRTSGVRAWIRSLGRWLGDTVAQKAYSTPVNKRGIERPQRGIQRFCAGLLAKGLVRTGGHSRILNESLIERGLAVMFDGTMPPPPQSRTEGAKRVAERVRQLLGVQASAHAAVSDCPEELAEPSAESA